MMPKNEYVQKLVPIYYVKVTFVKYYKNMENYMMDKGDEFLPLLAFRRDIVTAIFLKYSKDSKLSSSHLGIRNIPSDVYDDTKHY